MIMVSAGTPNYRGEPEQEVLLHLTRLFPPKERGWPRETRSGEQHIPVLECSCGHKTTQTEAIMALAASFDRTGCKQTTLHK